MTFLIANLLIIAVISRPVASNYDCLCYYGVEQAVYSKPDPASTPLGYVYEFDCKALDTAENHPEWWTIFFEHMTAYVPYGDNIIQQACSGDISPYDILTTKQAPSKSGYQSTTLSMPHSYVTGTLYNKQTGGYSTTPLTKSSLNTKPSTSTMSLSTKLSTSRLLLSTNLSLKQSSVIDVSYSKQTSRNGLSPGSKLYFTPTSATSNASRSNTILTSTFLLLTFNHQNTWSSNASPNPNSYLITTPSTSSSRSAAMSTLTNLLSRIYSKYLTENIWTSLKANLSLDNSSTSSIRSSTQTTAELKGTSRPLTLFNMTTNSGKKTEMGSSGTTIPKSMFNVPSSVPTTTVAISTRAAINITRTLPTKTIVASGGTTILSIPSNVTSSLPINTVISPTKTSIPQILFNVTSRTPTKTDTVVASQWTTLSPIQSTKTLGFNTKMKLTSHKAALLTNVLITTRFRTGNAAKSTCTAKQLNHFNTTTSSSSKMEIPSKVTTLSQILSNKTLKHLTTNNGITDNIDHTSFNSNNTFIQPKTVITKVFNKMTSTTVRQSNIIIKVNWTTVSNQSETSKPAIIDVTTNSSFIYNSFQPNTTALGVRTPSWSSQTSPSTTSVKGENSVTVINKFYTPIPTIPAVVRGTTDKWSVEMCPYYMLSRNKYNGSLDHPYPLVRRVGQHCYEFNTKLDNWYIARSTCRQKGGDLVVLDTEKTEITVLSMLKELQFGGEVWIGLNDIDNDSVWTWVNGGQYQYEHWDTLSNSDPVYNIRRNCAVMKTATGQWKKTVCRGFLLEMPRHYFICQYSI